MSGVLITGSMSKGHDGYPPAKFNRGSPDVFVNGKSVGREGDIWDPHCSGCHAPKNISTGRKVYVNGKEIAAIGDPLDCGDTIATGSGNVFVG